MWRKTWQDLKIKNITSGTGGGPPLPNVILSSSEEKLMNILGETAVQGYPDNSESIVTEGEPENISMTGSKTDQPTHQVKLF
ncbi:hypothetical protein JTB14_035117 [Gonioctena quinquepunctata]|nr:hypothetical protein JTB14_035117 [Gonioctena quinquepunctata]